MAIPDVEELYDQVEVGTPDLHRLDAAHPAQASRQAAVAANLAVRMTLGRGARRVRPRPAGARRRPSGPGAPTASTSASSPSGRASRGSGPARSATATCAATAPALSSAGAAPATVARKLAAIRGLYGFLVRTERAGAEPGRARLQPEARRRSCRRCSPPSRCATLLERIPARTPLELRDRAMLELAYSCGLRCEEIVNLDLGALDFETEQLRVLGKGSKERLLPVGEPAQRALRALPGARAAARSPPIRASRRSSSPRAAAASPTPTSPAGSASGSARRRSPPASPRTRCAIPSPPTCSRAAPTCARSRSCSATPRSRPPRSTPGSTRPACATRTLQATRAHEPNSPQPTIESAAG